MPRRTLVPFALLICFVLGNSPVSARQKGDAAKEVRFRPGATTASVRTAAYSGTVRGRAFDRYRISGKTGQRLTVKLTSKSTFLYFNVLDARTDTALETTPMPREVTDWSGALPRDGQYVVQVYLVRAEARRSGRADYRLSFALGGGANRR
jgi:hypothetical protein